MVYIGLKKVTSFVFVLIAVDKLPETFVEGSYFQNQDLYIHDLKYASREVFHQVFYVSLAREEVLCFSWMQVYFVLHHPPLCLGFLVLYWIKSLQKWALLCPRSLPASVVIIQCLSYCECTTHTVSGGIHKLLGVTAHGVNKLISGVLSKREIFFPFSALFLFYVFF